jgi:hypothetical protein
MNNRSHFKAAVVEAFIKEGETHGFTYDDETFTLEKLGVKFSPELGLEIRHCNSDNIDPWSEFEVMIKYETKQRERWCLN